MSETVTIDCESTTRKRRFLSCVMLLVCLIATGEACPVLLKDQLMTIDGKARSYDLYIPDTHTDRAYPLVFLLHGHMGSADVLTGENRKPAPYRVWLDIAEREHLLLVIPDGEKGADGYRGWNDCRADTRDNPHTDDVAFIDRLIEAVAARYRVDYSRLYATGISNGGMMVYRLALERSKVFAAVAPVVASLPARSQCGSPASSMPLLILNGTADPFVPWQGGAIGRGRKSAAERGTVTSVADSAKFWVDHNAIAAAPVSRDLPDIDTADHSTVRVTRYGGGRDGSEVLLYEVIGGGHAVPSISERYGYLHRLVLGDQNRDIETAEAIWQFFKRHHRDPVR